ncbi:acyl dehydratase [Alphaproteobacteria bacterium GH1-50]|uniref:Acyl dehydratase n=1 Tax=Kangsaoukella pontilimi TaxID=2691042 RepID=A0A7C9MLS5_9RHOB|nr:MaoC family dehydratase N-terminal domain-containing protein [Kangsaoukella pontilimi]MXQ09495.1 acyl dehydratase [Kangsaoukella pontilimi]
MSENATTETTEDRIDIARAAALMAAVDGAERDLTVGSALPPFAHHAFFWAALPEAALGRDGTPAPGQGGPVPDLGLPVRMYAGGQVRWHAPFRASIQAERVSRVTSITRKEGQSGALAFVTIRHDIRQRGQAVLSEDQTLVYRGAAGPGDPVTVTEEVDERRALKLTAVGLFRFSALTFNGHRIHYDADYARELGYPGLVVHAPLMAMHLALWAEERQGRLDRFAFRAVSPLYLGDVAWLCRAGNRYWVEGPKRRLCLTAEAG